MPPGPRYAEAGLKGLRDRERSGRPPVYGHDDRLRVVATVTETPPDGASHWTHQGIADRLADTGMSADTVGAILKDLDLKPHLVRGWLAGSERPRPHLIGFRAARPGPAPAGGSDRTLLTLWWADRAASRSSCYSRSPAWPTAAGRSRWSTSSRSSCTDIWCSASSSGALPSRDGAVVSEAELLVHLGRLAGAVATDAGVRVRVESASGSGPLPAPAGRTT